MPENGLLRIGETIDLYTGRGMPYRTKIEDFTEDGLVVASTPFYRGIPVVLLRDQELELYFYRENGRYAVDVVLRYFFMSGNIRMLVFEVVSEERKEQLRDSYRLRKFIDIRVRDYDEGPLPNISVSTSEKGMPATTEDISETGAGIRLRKRYAKGDRLYVTMYLDWPTPNSPPIDFLCEIMHVEQVTGQDNVSYYRLGLRFVDNSEDSRAMLAKYIIREQQRAIVRRRLVEEA